MTGNVAESSPINVTVDDLPHPDAGVEWWYLNFHFCCETGREYAAFIAFFRAASGKSDDPTDPSMVDTHTVTWALVDLAEARYECFSGVDEETMLSAYEILCHDQVLDSKLRTALRNTFAAGKPVPPDQPIDGLARLAVDRLHLRYGESAELEALGDGGYRVAARTPDGRTAFDFIVVPRKPPVWHGTNGYVRSGTNDTGDGMRYYTITRAKLSGNFTLNGECRPVASGSAWYDHEYGGRPYRRDRGLSETEMAWTWAGLQLDNGWDVSCYTLTEADVRTGQETVVDTPAIAVAPDGTRHALPAHVFEATEEWTSLQTFNTYPMRMTLRASSPALDVDLELIAAFPRQELRTITMGHSFWEGRMTVRGHLGGQPVTGIGFVEVLPAQLIADLDVHLKRAGRETRRQIESLYPDRLDVEGAADFIGQTGARLVADLDVGQLDGALVKPIRHLANSGGKFWRPYALVTAFDLLGGDSDPYRTLLAGAELLHVGSLVVDDVEDDSPMRRGVPAVHVEYGAATAINAGTAAYFAFDRSVRQLDLDIERRVRLYELFCEAMRAVHVGQAMDIAGHDDMIRHAIDTGEAAAIEKRVLAVHRLKTGMPVRFMAALSGIIAGAGKQQRIAVEDYFETLGLAFQIVDDVVDLRGSVDGSPRKRRLKALGDDIRRGKVSYPVAKAVQLLPAVRMRELWQAITAQPSCETEVLHCIAVLEECGALEQSLQYARDLTEDAWLGVEDVIKPSITSSMLRALGWYVVYRDSELN